MTIKLSVQLVGVKMTTIQSQKGSIRESQFKNYRSLSFGEYDQLSAATSRLSEFEEIFFSPKILYWRFERSAKNIRNILARASYDLFHASNLQRSIVSSEMQSCLEAFKVFVEHSPIHMSESYKPIFVAARDNLYNTNFPYRFVQELRNFGQHNDLPITSMKAYSKTVDEVGNQIATFDIFVNRDDLLRRRKWGNHLATLESMPKDIDIIPLLNQGFQAISDLHYKRMNEEEIPRYLPDMSFLLNLVTPYWDKDYIPTIFITEEDIDAKHSSRYYHLPIFLLIDVFKRYDLAGGEAFLDLEKNFGLAPLPDYVVQIKSTEK